VVLHLEVTILINLWFVGVYALKAAAKINAGKIPIIVCP